MSVPKYLALITGGAQGFGKAFAKKLLSNGGRVALLDIDLTEGNKLVEECRDAYGGDSTHFFRCDVTDLAQLQDCFTKSKEALGGLNIVCNNAGTANIYNRATRNYDIIPRLINLNLTSVINGTHLAVEHMSALRGGNGGLVINTASMAGLVPMSFGAEYAATKHGVVGFTRSLRNVFQEDKVRVNCLCPEFVGTRLVTDGMANHANFKNAIEAFGLMPIDDVTEAFYGLVQDTEKDGACVLITPAQGIRDVKLSIKFLDSNGNSKL